MGPKKQNKPNAFLYFMQEQRPIVEKRVGHKVTMADMPEHCGAAWKAMPPKAREVYKRNELGVKGKMDSRGRLLTEIEEEDKKYKDTKETMQRDIHNTVEMLKKGNAIPDFEFHVIGMTYYVETDVGQYEPAELAVIKFSFEKGIMNSFHRIIAANIPPGFKFEARQHSEVTHNIPFNYPDGEDDLGRLRDEMVEFILQGSESTPPLYTLESLRDQTQNMIDTNFGSFVKIYSLDMLLQLLYPTIIPKSIATEMLTSCKLDYIPSLGCTWHQATFPDACVFCPLSTCQRWLFLICDELRIDKDYGIRLIVGKHKPIREDGQEDDVEEEEEEIVSPAYPSKMAWGVNRSVDVPRVCADDASFPALGRGRGRGIQSPEMLEEKLSNMRIGMTGIGRGKIPKFYK